MIRKENEQKNPRQRIMKLKPSKNNIKFILCQCLLLGMGSGFHGDLYTQ